MTRWWVIYMTTQRGVQKALKECNAARAVLQDVSMDMGFREELKSSMKDGRGKVMVPRVFVRGKDVGGLEEVVRIAEDGAF
ncbi:hypothetical protein MLD38_039206 [Melastoma candidum]|uniref:Uncharacterized protein n=1 Tax=Melastoma candidum TaxID=119954 RepID=A0ACB9L1N1_9MYRT|nr:hypothetical protein MLD38_039206 [Melastoma candidum]